MLDESASQNWAYCSKFSEDKGEVVAVYLDSNICRKTGLSTHIKIHIWRCPRYGRSYELSPRVIFA